MKSQTQINYYLLVTILSSGHYRRVWLIINNDIQQSIDIDLDLCKSILEGGLHKVGAPWFKTTPKTNTLEIFA